MRPRDPQLRKDYADAAANVLAMGKSLTSKNLADQLHKEWKAVRKFLRREPELATRLGVQIRKMSTLEQYQEAIASLEERQLKITHARLAKELGKDRTSVTRYLDAHSELRIGKLEKRRSAKITLKRGQEIGVSYLHETTLRMTFAPVTLAEYIRLWDKGLLKFQQEDMVKPEHLPTRKDVARFLKQTS